MSQESIEILVQVSGIVFFSWLYFSLAKISKQLKDSDSIFYQNYKSRLSPRMFRLMKFLMPINKYMMLFLLLGNVVGLTFNLSELFFE